MTSMRLIHCRRALLLQPSHYLRSALLKELSDYLLARFKMMNDMHDLEEAVQHSRDALHRCPPGHDHHIPLLSSLAGCLSARYQRHRAIQDLQKAIQLHRSALLLCPPEDCNRAGVLSNLASCLLLHYEAHSDDRHFEEAIQLLTSALLLYPPGHPDRSVALNHLATCFSTRYEKQGDINCLEEAIQHHRAALVLCTSRKHIQLATLRYLASCLQDSYEIQGSIQDLREAIQFLREALLVCPLGDPGRLEIRHDLAGCLFYLYKSQGSIHDVEEAIQIHRDSLPLHPKGAPNRVITMISIASCLHALYESRRDTKGLEEAIQLYRTALLLDLTGYPSGIKILGGLAICLQTWYETQGGDQALEEAIQLNRDALALYPSRHPDQSSQLNNLAGCLIARYQSQGAVQDLEEAIQISRDALRLCLPGLPASGHATILSVLAFCLQTKYTRGSDIQDLEEAIQLNRETLLCHPSDHSNQSRTLDYLAGCLLARYERQDSQEEIQDLEEAIQLRRNAMAICHPENPQKPVLLRNLADSLLTRFEEISLTQDLEEAIELVRDALALYPHGHLDQPGGLNSLARCLLARYKHGGNIQDLEDFTDYIQQAIHITPPSHPALVKWWRNLAAVYAGYSQLLSLPLRSEDAMELFEMASDHPTASFQDRLEAALTWIKLTDSDDASSLKAYKKALQLADQYILTRSSVTSRHQLLSTIPHSLASDADASAIDAGELETAVEFLEQGRTLLWSQMGRYRLPLDILQKVDADLAAEFKLQSRELEASAVQDIKAGMARQSLESEAQKYRIIAETWTTTLHKIRQIDGFATFLRPTEFSNLKMASQNGPVIIVNISTNHSDAIILHNSGDPLVVALPSAQPRNIIRLVATLAKAVKESTGNKTKILQDVLRCLWNDVVEPIVRKLQEIKIPTHSRIWWCPTSYLGMLPLHAAGPYRRRKPNLPDIYISSYTPTLSALIRSSRPSAQNTAVTTNLHHQPCLLVVAQPESPTQIALPNVQSELQKIKEIVPSVDELLGEDGTRDTVLAGLLTHNWVHIASHGSQNLTDPFSSCFHLHGGPLSLLDIAQANLPNAEYAFLSACHTAAGDVNAPDETIHLAAGLQFSGFRSVIGTMYAMADIDGPVVAEAIYKRLFRRSREGDGKSVAVLDYRDAAEALNIATKYLRDTGVPLERWINFVHIGA